MIVGGFFYIGTQYLKFRFTRPTLENTPQPSTISLQDELATSVPVLKRALMTQGPKRKVFLNPPRKITLRDSWGVLFVVFPIVFIFLFIMSKFIFNYPLNY